MNRVREMIIAKIGDRHRLDPQEVVKITDHFCNSEIWYTMTDEESQDFTNLLKALNNVKEAVDEVLYRTGKEYWDARVKRYYDKHNPGGTLRDKDNPWVQAEKYS